MGTKEKLQKKLLSKPKDFKWSDLTTLLTHYGYREIKGSGSKRKFYLETPRSIISLHKPHPGEIVKGYVIKEVIIALKNIGVINGNTQV